MLANPPPTCSLLRLLMKAFIAMVAFFHCAPVSGLAADTFPALPGAFAAVIMDYLRFSLCSTFAFQAALPSDTSTQQHAMFVCIPACVPLGHHISEKPLAHIPGIPSFSLLSTLCQVSKFIAILCARFTLSPFISVFSDCLHSLLIALGVQTNAFKQGFLVFIPRSLLKKQILPSGRVSLQSFSLRPCSDASWSRPVDVLGDIIFIYFFCVCTVVYLHKSSRAPSAGETKSNWLIYLLSLELTPISGMR